MDGGKEGDREENEEGREVEVLHGLEAESEP